MANRTMHFKIYRYDPDKDAKPYMQDISVEIESTDRKLLDVMVKLKSVDDSLSFVVGDFERSSIQKQGNGTGPLRVPAFVRHLAAVGIEPCNILDHGEFVFSANHAILEELAPMQIGMLETKLNEVAREVQKPFARLRNRRRCKR